MEIPKHPLAEVFGHLTTDFSERAVGYRRNKLCPFNNKVPNCAKDKAKNPLGVCSIFHNHSPVITCPIRFREDWLVVKDAADFFFPEGARWSSLTEVRLNDGDGKSAGNIDVVLVAYDEKERIYDFGALEIQAVYFSGNIREPFEYYMNDPQANQVMDWTGQPNYPCPDHLFSSQKLFARLSFKTGILKNWHKKMAVFLDLEEFSNVPNIEYTSRREAEVGWFIYNLIYDDRHQRYKLVKVDEKFSKFPLFLSSSTRPSKLDKFMKVLEEKISKTVIIC